MDKALLVAGFSRIGLSVLGKAFSGSSQIPGVSVMVVERLGVLSVLSTKEGQL